MLLTCAVVFFATTERVMPITNADGTIVASAALLNKWTAITAAHAVGEVRTVVFLRCGEEDVAGVVSRRARVHDLALIQLLQPCSEVTPVELAREEPVEGEDITFEGYPSGKLEHGHGKVRGFAMFAVRERRAGGGLFWIGLVLSADVRPGNSGGPVLSKSGKLVGVVHGYHEPTVGKPGVAVALPAIAQFLASTED